MSVFAVGLGRSAADSLGCCALDGAEARESGSADERAQTRYAVGSNGLGKRMQPHSPNGAELPERTSREGANSEQGPRNPK